VKKKIKRDDLYNLKFYYI